MVNKANKVTLI